MEKQFIYLFSEDRSKRQEGESLVCVIPCNRPGWMGFWAA